MQKIGFLLPRSSFYDTMGFDLFEGLRSGLQHIEKYDVKIIIENISFGADKQQCYRCAEKLVLEENVAIVVAYIGHRMAELLKPLFLATNKILLVLDPGASMPQEWPTCSSIFYHSLQNAFGAWLTAQKAVKEGYQTGGMVTNYYDGGYLHTYGITKGYEWAKGTICFNHATGFKPEDFTMEPLQNHLSQNPNSALLSLFSGDFTQWYFAELKKWFENQDVPVYLSPFGLEETMLENAVFASNKISGVAAWSRNIATPENKTFMDTIVTSGRKANLFNLLGWESASIINKILELFEIHKNNTSSIAAELMSFDFESPRGKISFDSKTNTTVSPLYDVTVIENMGNCEIVVNGKIDNIKTEFETFSTLNLDNAVSAWFNSYTCN
ncbi:ABC transporter substrate-binding protein [Flavobacterium sp. RS13.1]|uniref:ABC transporter substrate-binding protein n=1 Tax=Flavobacterium sp. RS13.1 TaxID=3400345 RepID=UPI003AAD6525